MNKNSECDANGIAPSFFEVPLEDKNNLTAALEYIQKITEDRKVATDEAKAAICENFGEDSQEGKDMTLLIDDMQAKKEELARELMLEVLRDFSGKE